MFALGLTQLGFPGECVMSAGLKIIIISRFSSYICSSVLYRGHTTVNWRALHAGVQLIN